MKAVLKKYEVILSSVNWNDMYPEQDQIVSLTIVVEKLKYNNLNISKP